MLVLNLCFACPLRPFQCTRDVLQEYYVNLVRTFSSGRYIISDASSSSISSDSDMDFDTSPAASPVPTPQPPLQFLQTQRSGNSMPGASRLEPSAEAPQLPTLEQNMAFAALQQQEQGWQQTEQIADTSMDTS